MYAVIGRVEIDSSRADEAAELLNNYTVPMVKQAPGFVSGTWAAVRGRNARTEPPPLREPRSGEGRGRTGRCGTTAWRPSYLRVLRGVRGARPGLDLAPGPVLQEASATSAFPSDNAGSTTHHVTCRPQVPSLIGFGDRGVENSQRLGSDGCWPVPRRSPGC